MIRSRSKTNKKHNYWGFKTQVEMFIWIWENRPHKCQLTDVELNFIEGSEEWFQVFGHILRKSKYTYFKLNPDNIVLLHPDIHNKMDNWTSDMKEVKLHSEWLELQRHMKVEYEKFKKANCLA